MGDWAGGKIPNFWKIKNCRIRTVNFPVIDELAKQAWGQHESGYQALIGAPDNITVIFTTAKHHSELFSF